MLIDWKMSGIGPLFVDLLQLFLLLPRRTREDSARLIAKFVKQYIDELHMSYKITFSMPVMLCTLRDVCLLLAAARPFAWNFFGAVGEELAYLHKVLIEMTTENQLLILNASLQ